MKVLAYASLAIGAQAGVMEFLEQEMGNKFRQTHDGFVINFAPYFSMTIEDNGMSGQIKTSKDGLKMDEDNWESTNSGMRTWGSGHGSNTADLPLIGDVMSQIDTYEYEGTSTFVSKFTGGTFSWDKEIEFDYNDGSSGSINEEGQIKVGYASSSQKMQISLESEIARDNSNVARFRYSPFYEMMKEFDWEGKSTVVVKNVQGCNTYMRSATGVCSVQYNGQMKYNNKNLPRVSANVRLADYAAQFKFSQGGSPTQMVFVKSTDRSNAPAKLSALEYYELYHAVNHKNWQAAIKADAATLILRAPMCAAIEDEVMPELMNMAEPFLEFGEAAASNMAKIPYIFYYMDKLFATLDDEFDCGAVVEASRIESDMLAQQVLLNDYLVAQCGELNDMIVEALQCDELAGGMEAMREYVEDMSSARGEAFFTRTFGNVF